MIRFKILPLIVVASMLIVSGCGSGVSRDTQQAVPGQNQISTDSNLQTPGNAQKADTNETANTETSNLQSGSTVIDKTAGSGTSDKSSESVNKSDSTETSAEVVVKTDTNVSDEKAAKALQEIDQEMDNLVNILNNMDDISDSSLEF
ncbi:MAG: hypothetical protein QME46_01020 [Thermoanaerobacteraceae bacterium]|nr:hypothetical protein [Thermoanaerobacteraceae bacterium]